MGAGTRDHYPAWEEAREALQDWRSPASATTPQLFPSTHLTTHPRMCIHSLNLPICTPSHLSTHLFPVYLPRQPSAIYLLSFPKHRLSQILYTFVLPSRAVQELSDVSCVNNSSPWEAARGAHVYLEGNNSSVRHSRLHKGQDQRRACPSSVRPHP